MRLINRYLLQQKMNGNDLLFYFLKHFPRLIVLDNLIYNFYNISVLASLGLGGSGGAEVDLGLGK